MSEYTDKLVQSKLDQIARLSRELAEEAERRYGPDGNLFCEADGGLHLMDGDASGQFDTVADRQSHIKFTAKGVHRIGVGAW